MHQEDKQSKVKAKHLHAKYYIFFFFYLTKPIHTATAAGSEVFLGFPVLVSCRTLLECIPNRIRTIYMTDSDEQPKDCAI